MSNLWCKMDAAMVYWLTILALAAAGDPLSGHRFVLPPAAPPVRGQAFDTRVPAFVPKFARVDNPPGGHFAERDWAYRYGAPAPFGYGCGGAWGSGYCGSVGGFPNYDGHFIGTAGDACR